MTEIQIEINCDLCGSAEKTYIKTEDGYPISRCRECSFIYVNRIPQIENGKVIGEYYEGSEREISESKHRYQRVSKFLVEEINRLHPDKGRLLDVGCGYGFFMLEAKKNGWRVSGTELSHIAVNYAREKLDLTDVFFTDLSDDEFLSGKFEAINLTNVLEHVPSPTKTLSDCKRHLADGGILMIRVPNMDFNNLKEHFTSVIKFIRPNSGGELNYLATRPPYHLSGFTPRTLRRYFQKAGLETIEVKPSKLSAMADENFLYRALETFVNLLYKISLRRINLSPTILAIAVKKS